MSQQWPHYSPGGWPPPTQGFNNNGSYPQPNVYPNYGNQTQYAQQQHQHSYNHQGSTHRPHQEHASSMNPMHQQLQYGAHGATNTMYTNYPQNYVAPPQQQYRQSPHHQQFIQPMQHPYHIQPVPHSYHIPPHQQHRQQYSQPVQLHNTQHVQQQLNQPAQQQYIQPAQQQYNQPAQQQYNQPAQQQYNQPVQQQYNQPVQQQYSEPVQKQIVKPAQQQHSANRTPSQMQEQQKHLVQQDPASQAHSSPQRPLSSKSFVHVEEEATPQHHRDIERPATEPPQQPEATPLPESRTAFEFPSFPNFEMQYKQFQKRGDLAGEEAKEAINRSHLLITNDEVNRTFVTFCKWNPLHVLDLKEIGLHESACIDRDIIYNLKNL